MSSTTTVSIIASDTALLSITTPFVRPPGCEAQWKTTSVVSTVLPGTTLINTVMISEPAVSCYPSGWDRAAPESLLSFSPGVCPDVWTYYGIAENSFQAATTAFCCDSGFSWDWSSGSHTIDGLVKNRCEKWTWNTRTATGLDLESRATSSQIEVYHEAWAVTWAASDTATLTPKLPTITSSMTVPRWTPGETILDGMWDADKGQDNGPQFDGPFLFVIIGLPIIGVLVLSFYIGCCVRACYKKSRERRVIYVVDPNTFARTYEMNARVAST